ncbi:hypothetical protein GCM10027599_00830 [Yimella radicis]
MWVQCANTLLDKDPRTLEFRQPLSQFFGDDTFEEYMSVPQPRLAFLVAHRYASCWNKNETAPRFDGTVVPHQLGLIPASEVPNHVY